MQHETAHKVYHHLDSLAMPIPARAATPTAKTPPSMAAPPSAVRPRRSPICVCATSYASSLPDRIVGCQKIAHDKHHQIAKFVL